MPRCGRLNSVLTSDPKLNIFILLQPCITYYVTHIANTYKLPGSITILIYPFLWCNSLNHNLLSLLPQLTRLGHLSSQAGAYILEFARGWTFGTHTFLGDRLPLPQLCGPKFWRPFFLLFEQTFHFQCCPCPVYCYKGMLNWIWDRLFGAQRPTFDFHTPLYLRPCLYVFISVPRLKGNAATIFPGHLSWPFG